jgi:hypothetical protein
VRMSVLEAEPCLHRINTYVSLLSCEADMPLVEAVTTRLNAGDLRHSTSRGWPDAARERSVVH